VELFVPPRKGRRHILRLIRDLLFFEPKRRRTNIPAALAFLNHVLHRRSIVFLLTDFLHSLGPNAGSVVAGRDSSEWAYDCPAVKPAMRHQRAKIYLSFPTIFDKPCAGHFYFTKYPLDGVKEIRSIDFEWLGPPGALIIDKIMLINEQTNSSYHIESTAFAGTAIN